MGHNEAATPKLEQTSSIVQPQEQAAVHLYPDWAAMQAYYGHGVMPSPYFGPTLAPGHAPHPYIWGPQPLIAPPFGSPYTAIYQHGGVYPHPPMPLGPHAHCQGTAPSSEAVVMATPLNMEMPAKSTGNKEKMRPKKFKRVDGLSMDINSTADAAGANGNGLSQSGYSSAEGSSGGSDGNNTLRGTKSNKKRCSEDIPSSENIKVEIHPNPANSGEVSSKVPVGITAVPATIAGKPLGHAPAPILDMKVASTGKLRSTGTPGPPATGAILPSHSEVPSELWMQEERELKRERRKQSNRESARRSRLRKQAEAEELAMKVENISAENTNLRYEISRLTENSDNLRLENTALMEKLKNAESRRTAEISLDTIKSERSHSVVLENFLSIIDNPSSVSRTREQEHEATDRSTSKLHQLLDASPRTDAVVAS